VAKAIIAFINNMRWADRRKCRGRKMQVSTAFWLRQSASDEESVIHKCVEEIRPRVLQSLALAFYKLLKVLGHRGFGMNQRPEADRRSAAYAPAHPGFCSQALSAKLPRIIRLRSGRMLQIKHGCNMGATLRYLCGYF
jgi:hypothetical protein